MKIIISILLIMIFTSCDPGVINKYVVENRTESDLEIKSLLKYENRNTTEKDTKNIVELKPRTKSLIREYGEIGNAHDKGSNFLNRIDTIIVKMDHRILVKAIFNRKNWNYKVLKSSFFSLDEVEYKLTLIEKDFE